MTLNRNLKMGMVGGEPGAFIGAVHRKASRMDGRTKQAICKTPLQYPLPPEERVKKPGFAAPRPRFWSSFNSVLLAAVAMIVLCILAALIVYFSDAGSPHREGLQKTLIETLIMGCMLGVGTIFGLLGAKFRRRG